MIELYHQLSEIISYMEKVDNHNMTKQELKRNVAIRISQAKKAIIDIQINK
jgi:hypothetical protein